MGLVRSVCMGVGAVVLAYFLAVPALAFLAGLSIVVYSYPGHAFLVIGGGLAIKFLFESRA